MLDQAVRASQAGGVGKELDCGGHLKGFGLPAFHLDGEHAAKAGHLRGCDLVPRMAGQARIVYGLDLGLLTQEFRYALCAFRVGADAVRKRLQAANVSQHSKGEGTAPPSRWILRAFSKSESAFLKISVPAVTSLCPERYLVIECMLTSAPSSSGRCSSGVAQVLSHATRAPDFLAIAVIARMSQTVSRGFDGVSVQINRVPGVTARSIAPRSRMSTNVDFSPQDSRWFFSRTAVP